MTDNPNTAASTCTVAAAKLRRTSLYVRVIAKNIPQQHIPRYMRGVTNQVRFARPEFTVHARARVYPPLLRFVFLLLAPPRVRRPRNKYRRAKTRGSINTSAKCVMLCSSRACIGSHTSRPPRVSAEPRESYIHIRRGRRAEKKRGDVVGPGARGRLRQGYAFFLFGLSHEADRRRRRTPRGANELLAMWVRKIAVPGEKEECGRARIRGYAWLRADGPSEDVMRARARGSPVRHAGDGDAEEEVVVSVGRRYCGRDAGLFGASSAVLMDGCACVFWSSDAVENLVLN